MAWTREQQQAIDTDRKNILVSAAAGSGKTAVLTERVVSHLLRPENAPDAWNIDELLIVTFTRAAAAEMSERIGRRLHQAIGDELGKPSPDKGLVSRLEKQVILLSSASISTIDSFCQKIVKNNFAAIDLDPKFRVANENELLLMQQDVLDELFECQYNLENEALLRLGDKYGSDRGDGSLYNMVLALHAKAMNQPFPERWLRGLAEDFVPTGGAQHLSDYHKWWQVCMAALESGMEQVRDEFAVFSQLVECVEDKKARGKYDERRERIQGIISKIKAGLQGEWQDIYTAFRDLDYRETGFLSMPTGKLDIDPELREQLKSSNSAIKDILMGLKKEYILDAEETMLADLQALAADAEGMAELTLAFGDAYSAAKRERNIIDYSDMEHLALRILLAEDSPPGQLCPSPAALALRSRYREIMVDEYQDTNEVQDAIVRLIAGEDEGRLFAVGDVKQSIYGFRSSEPGLFIRKYEAYGRECGDRGGQNALISLGRNFRSRREILSGVNFVFAQLMSKKLMAIDYDANAMLKPGEPYGYGEPEEGRTLPPEQAVELDIIVEKGLAEENMAGECAQEDEQEELKNFQLEAQHIADKLKKLKAEGYLVFDKNMQGKNNGYRPVQWRDMVILLRAVTGKAEVLQEILQANDIPVFASIEGGYFQTTEIQVITSLLAVIDNAQQDIPLAAVLYSPIVGMSAEQLAKLRLSGEAERLYGLLIGAGSAEVKLSGQIKRKAADFLAQLSTWRQLAQRIGVAELLWQIYQDTGYYDYVGCMPGGLLRQANLRMLITRAEEFEGTDFRGLFRFLSFIEKIKSMDTDLSMARTLGENEDVVRVMSIHKSKGLEFPVVVLADMNKGFNLTDVKENIIVHKDLGLGLYNIDTDKSVKYPSFSRIAVRSKMIQESKAEELRVLYVAMTRAREKLIMTGRVRDGAKAAAKWCRCREYDESVRLPEYAVMAGGSYLDWVASAAARHPDGAAFAGLLDMTEEQYIQPLGYIHAAMGREAHWKINLLPAGAVRLPGTASGGAGELLAAVLKGEPLTVRPEVQGKIEAVLTWQYDFRGTEELPAKLSVSELKRRFAKEQAQTEPAEVSVQTWDRGRQREYTYPRPAFLQRQEERLRPRTSGAEYGTLLHTVMQHLDLSGSLDERDIARQLRLMADREVIAAPQIKMVDLGQAAGFFASELGQRMVRAPKLWRELPFSRMLPAQQYYPGVQDSRVQIFNQGVIDVLFEEADGRLVLLDYKTDRDTAPSAVRASYELQLKLYSQAVAALLGRPPAEKYLYMLRDGSVIQL